MRPPPIRVGDALTIKGCNLDDVTYVLLNRGGTWIVPPELYL